MKTEMIWIPEKKRPSLFKKVLSLLLIIVLLSGNLPQVAADEEQPLTLTQTVDKNNPLTGEEFVYTLKYANPNMTQKSYNVVLRDVLPENIKYVSFVKSDDVESVSVTNDGTHDIVEFKFYPELSSGRTGFVKIVAKFPEGKTPATINGNPNTAINTATIQPEGGQLVTSNPVTVTPRLNAPDWSLTKTRYIPSSVLPCTDQNITYEVTVKSNSVIGGMDLKDIVVSDTIPEGSEFVSASDGGSYEDGVVTWNIANLDVGKQKKLYVVLKYPSVTFTTSSTVTNNVTADATQFDGSAAPQRTATASHGFITPTYNVGTFSKNSRQSNDRYSVGQTAKFTLDSIKNSGNVPFDKLVITDSIPAEINLTQISTGAYSTNVDVGIRYKSHLNTEWTQWNANPYSSPNNTTLNVSALSLAEGDYVTDVEWTITGSAGSQLQPGFTNTASIRVNGTVSEPAVGNKITNTAQLQAFVAENPVSTKNASKDIYVVSEMPWLVAEKTVKNNQIHFNYNETVEFNLRIKNNDFATGNYIDPVVIDTIPSEFENITYIGWDKGNSSITQAPDVDTSGTKNISGKDYSLLRADVTGSLAPGEYIDIKYQATIKDKTDAGYLSNTMYISTKDNATQYENDASELISDTNDLDEDGHQTDQFVKDDVKIFVNFMGSLQSELKIKGEYDSDYGTYEYPLSTQTLSGGIVSYRLTIKNSGSNGPISNLVLVDKLPNINDTGVVDTQSRDSKWSPYLVNLITGENGSPLSSDITIYYSTVVNPSCEELKDPLDKTGNPSDEWSTTPPKDITTVKSIKIDFGNMVFKTGDSVTIEWPMRAPVGAPTDLIAWNSFGYSATYPDSDGTGESEVQSAFLPSEPLKVGFKINEPELVNAGNFVWEDKNKNGIQDPGEKGINGVLVNLYRKNGSAYDLAGYTRTGFNHDGDSGYYLFPKIPAGTYKLQFVYPKTYTDSSGYESDYYTSPYLSGSDITIDSNGNPGTSDLYTDMGIEKNSVETSDFTLNTGEDLSMDLGLFRLGQIGDRVWYDRNADGIQNNGESGIEGVMVSLLDADGNSAKHKDLSNVDPVITDENGQYVFTNLEPGQYKVNFVIPNGYKLSPSNIGSSEDKDSDAIKDSGASATTQVITLESGEVNLNMDMGVYLAHIGNQIFHDSNADGIKDTNESGIKDVQVNLYKEGDPDVFQTTLTDDNGIYSFDDLFPDNYTVEVIKPSSYNKFSPSGGTTPLVDLDSDVNRSTGKTSPITISAGDRIDTIDGGLYQFGSLGDFVWNDKDADGVQDSGEPGISGITVQLRDKDGNLVVDGLGNPVSNQTTDPNGKYSFTNLEPGEYKVLITNPSQHYKWSPSNRGGNDSTDSDGAWTTDTDSIATISSIIISSGANNTSVDQGMYLAAIGDFVWNDLNANGIQDSGESGISNVNVTLLDESLNPATDIDGNPIGTIKTAANGSYRFDNLIAGKYIVQFTLPSGYNEVTLHKTGAADKDSDADTTTLRSDVITLTTAQRDMTVDAGFYKYASVGDYVWNDLNGNGLQDSGESGISGATVKLLNSTGTEINSMDTDENGKYLFDNLIPGDYYILINNPAGYDKVSPAKVGTDQTINSDLDISTKKTDVINLISGELDNTIDGGFYKYATIGDYIWEDVNGNGIQGSGEPAIQNVTVNLLSSTGSFLQSTTTDVNGLYSFTSLDPGTYMIEIVKPSGYGGITLKTQGSDSNKDSNIDRTTLRSNQVTIISGEINNSIDGGLYKNTSIGDFVWNDKNANGIQDPGETGISGLTVNLYNHSGTKTAIVTTDASGFYHFTDIVPDTYTVEVVKTAGYLNSPSNQGDDTTDSNLNTSTSKSSAFTILSGATNLTIDAGLYKKGSIGDFVWNDLDGDGVQDTGESGINGVTVRLLNILGSQITSTTTNATGYYSFTGLTPGTYYISIDKPSGYDSLSPKGQGGNTAKDSDLNTNLKSDVVTLISNESNNTIDAGFYKLCSIGDYVWEDLNANGIQDSGEPGISGATVKLLDNTGTEITRMDTDVDGKYLFKDLLPGDYYIAVDTPSGYDKMSPKGSGADSAKNSDLNFASNKSDIINLISGAADNTIDCGFYKYSSLGDYIWEDVDGNGVQDGNEPSVQGVQVNLLNNSGTLLQSDITDENGLYSFTALDPATYIIEIVKPDGYAGMTLKYQGDSTKDSNFDRTNFKSDPVTIKSGESNTTIDGGLYKGTSIGDLVWNDKNANGFQDVGENGISGVTVNLYDHNGTKTATVTTDEDGIYHFNNIVPDTYTVEVVKPSGYVNSPRNQGGSDSTDSNMNDSTSKSDPVTILSDVSDQTIDAGLYKKASLGDYVWEDLDGDGVQDSGEAGISGVTVKLLDQSGALITSTTTDENGYYSFGNLTPGTYYISVVQPDGFDCLSAKEAGGNTSQDSDLNADLKSDAVTLTSDENNDTIDAGFYKLCSIGDYVWNDLNANGIQDAGEQGISGVAVKLLNQLGVELASTTTNSTGYYNFNSLVPGTYYINIENPVSFNRLSKKAQGVDYAKDSDLNTNHISDAVVLISGTQNTTIDAGFYQMASIGDYVWEDLNINGIQDSNEKGIEGADVTLLDGSGTPLATTTTDASGRYLFDGLTPGHYQISFQLPNGYDKTVAKAQGSDSTKDSDIDPTTRTSDTLTVISGEDNLTVDAGFYQYSSIGDLVWNDKNANGIQDAGENGIQNVTINLYDNIGTKINSTETDENGLYKFEGLTPGSYTIELEKPAGYLNSPKNEGSAQDKDSNIDPDTSKSDLTTVVSGEKNMTIDAGLYKKASIGDYVWEDLDADGVQDSGEAGISGVTVKLLDQSGAFITSTTTDSDGYYDFVGLTPGTYYISVVQPDGFDCLSAKEAGGNTSQDSDLNADLKSDAVTLTSDENNDTIDAGFYKLCSIGDYVWNDLNANGIQDAGEQGISGVAVKLLNQLGVELTSTTTNSTGYYSFNNLVPGTYYIKIETPAYFDRLSEKAQGIDNTKDSDLNSNHISDAVVLISGTQNTTIDGGFYQLASIGDYVWDDLNIDGIQDGNEKGIEGAGVTLLDGSGTQLATTTTDASGRYLFDGLTPGHYQISFQLPNGYDKTVAKAQGSDSTKDSDIDPTTRTSDTLTVISGEDNFAVDAGFYQYSSIGDLVWNDKNANGIQDAGEDGISNITVNLYDNTGTKINSTATDENGLYKFEGLTPGSYTIELGKPAGYISSPKNEGSAQDKDSNIDPTTSKCDSITVESGEKNMTIDVGLYKKASIGDYVWEDLDADGIQDSGEAGISGVTVKLLDQSGAFITSTTTDSDGYYGFVGLTPGTYYISVVQPGGFDCLSVKEAGSNTSQDSDLNADLKSDAVTLTSDENNDTIDAGFYKLCSIGDYVWNDLNANGIQDAGEQGISGVAVKLLNQLGVELTSTTTNSTGYYSFNNLVPGTYYIKIETPVGFDRLSEKAQSIDNTKDSNLNPNYISDAIVLISGTQNSTIDGGFYQLASIGDYVWDDLNINGIQDSNEKGIEGVGVTLLDGSGTQLATTTTDASGHYLFDGLTPGDYQVSFHLPNGYDKTVSKAQGSDSTKDSDIDPTTRTSDTLTVISGEDNLTVDAGFYQYSTIGDLVWNDKNANGIQEADENGISNVTINLYDNAGTKINNTTTDENGLYKFEGLTPGNYTIELEKPAGYISSPKSQGSSQEKDSNIDPTTSKSDSINVVSGEKNMTIDVGLYKKASIGDYVWEDLDADGVQDSGEAGISGVIVKLLDQSGAFITSTTTDENGYYSFGNLTPGTYYISVVQPDGFDCLSAKEAGGNTSQDSDLNADLKSDAVTLTSDENNDTIDAGFYKLCSIGDYVWNDLNANGIQDAGEQGISGVAVKLLNQLGIELTSTTTNSTGYYSFNNLVPGTYYIKIETPVGFDRLSEKAQSIDNTKDSNLNPNYISDAIVLISGTQNTTIDGGFYQLASIGDYVWDDLNINGIQDSNEKGIQGAGVTLLDGSGAQLATTTTDVSGHYLFDGLTPGNYQVSFQLPDGYDKTVAKAQGIDSTKDSDIDPTTRTSDTLTVISGEDNLTVDAGFYQYSSIGDLVWNDKNANGIQDADEDGISNVIINLYDNSGNKINSTQTDPDGLYKFDGLTPGSYTVELEKPAGYLNSPKNEGSTQDKDSNINPDTSKSDSITVVSGEKNMTIDAGLYKKASIGDCVWDDLDADGVQDSGEAGISGVTVKLLDQSGTLITSTTTDENGYYSFGNLTPGTYYISVVQPDGFDCLSVKEAGSNTSQDSNLNTNLKSDPVTLISDENNDTIDTGFYKLCSIGDYVWNDLNANGIQDAGEQGISGVAVKLLNQLGVELTSTTTNSTGYYSFNSLVPGTYYIKIVKPASFDILSKKTQGIDNTKDSNLNTSFISDAVVLISGTQNSTIDGGFYQLASIGDYVWEDLNINGIQDSNERGIQGAGVTLLDGSGTRLATTTTDASGHYLFDGLTPGEYQVSFQLPAGYDKTVAKAQGSDPTKDSDIDPTTRTSDILTVISGEDNLTLDAGFYQYSSIGDLVWNDKNANGIQDAGELGIPNVTVNLYNNTGTKINGTTTNENGLYKFEGLTPGSYTIELMKPTGYLNSPKNQGSSQENDSNIDPTTSKSDLINVVSGEKNMTIDAGLYKLATLGNYVWDDNNADGYQDKGEHGIPGASVNLINSNNQKVQSVTTNPDGIYQFNSITPGTYKVEFVMPEGYSQVSPKNQGNDIALDSDIDTKTLRSQSVTLISGETNSTIDGGFYKLASLGNYVWEDQNLDGIQSETEHGIPFVKVNLYDGKGNAIATTVTNSQGFYLFDSLTPGSYQIEMIKPNNFGGFSQKQKGNNNTVDSDIDSKTSKSAIIKLSSGDSNDTIDAGLYKYSSIGDFIWMDNNANGIQDNGEAPLKSVKVSLLNGSGQTLATTFTNSNGEYLFDKLIPGNYIIAVSLPKGYDGLSVKAQGNDQTKDCDFNANLQSDLITLDYNQNNTSIDAGFYKTATIGDLVWYDDNSNGIQDESNRGVNGIKVTLLDKDGNSIKDTFTANNSKGQAGHYKFDKLIPGEYYIQFSQISSRYLPSKQAATSNGKIDSDGEITTLITKRILLGSGQTDLSWDQGIQFDSNPIKLIGAIGSTKSTDTLLTNGDNVSFQYAIEFDVPDNCVKLRITDDLEDVLKLANESNGIKIFTNNKDVSNQFKIIYNANTGMIVVEANNPSQLQPGRYRINLTCKIKENSDLSRYTDHMIPNLAKVEVNDTITITNTVYIMPIYSTIGNYVWIDKNRDGIQNESFDLGINGITVKLFSKNGKLIATTITKNDAKGHPGFYVFDQLNPGEYYVEFSNLPKNFIVTRQGVGNDSKNSDVNPQTLTTKVFTLNSGESQPIWSMGVYEEDKTNNIPKTGDHSTIPIYVIGILISAFLFFITKGKRRYNGKNS